MLGLDGEALGPADPGPVGLGLAEVVEDLAGDPVAVEGDLPELRRERRVVDELVELLVARLLLAVAVREGPGRRVIDTPVHRPVGRVDGPDLQAVRQRQLGDAVEVRADQAGVMPGDPESEP